jgi:hypothetical protein
MTVKTEKIGWYVIGRPSKDRRVGACEHKAGDVEFMSNSRLVGIGDGDETYLNLWIEAHSARLVTPEEETVYRLAGMIRDEYEK